MFTVNSKVSKAFVKHTKPVSLPIFGGILHIIGNFDNDHRH